MFINVKRATFLFFLLLNWANADEKFSFSGVIRDADDSVKLRNVTIHVLDLNIGTVTDQEGCFSIPIKTGCYAIRFSLLGYKTDIDTIEIINGMNIFLEKRLKPEPLNFAGVTVSADRPERSASALRLHIDAVTSRNLPPAGEPDIIKAARTLPGIIAANDFRGDFHVRGGGSDQNMILLDGVEIRNPYHLFGFLGTFNMEALEKAEVYVGDIPVGFGDRLSSALDVRTKAPGNSLTCNLSLLSSGFAMNRKIGNTSGLLALRRTYLDLVSPVDYSFTDINAKISHRAGRFKITGLGFWSWDGAGGTLWGGESGEKPANAPRVGWGNSMAAFEFEWGKPDHNIRTDASLCRNRLRFSGIDNGVREIRSRIQYRRSQSNLDIQFGLFAGRFSAEYDWDDSGSNGHDIGLYLFPSAPMIFSNAFSFTEHGAFGSVDWRPVPRLQTEWAARLVRWDGSSYWSPRFGVSLDLGGNLSLRSRFSRSHQNLVYGQESREGSISNVLFRIHSPMSADMISVGIVGGYGSIHGSVDFYARRVRGLARFGESFPNLLFGKGRAHGLEALLQKTQGPITCQASYGYLSTEGSFPGQSFPFDWEARHSFSVLAGYRLGGRWYLNILAAFRSGLPVTPVFLTYYKSRFFYEDQPYRQAERAYIEGDINSARLPGYFRLDASVRKTYFKKRYRYTLYGQVINLLNRGNPIRYDWSGYYESVSIDEEGNRIRFGATRGLPILPTIGVQFDFQRAEP